MKPTKKALKVLNQDSIKKRVTNLDPAKFTKRKKEKAIIYKIERENLPYEKLKGVRSGLRYKMKNYLTKYILTNAKQDNKEQQLKDIKAFMAFYKEHYILNDLSLNSLYDGKDELIIKDMQLSLDIIKASLSLSKVKGSLPKGNKQPTVNKLIPNK